MVAGTGMLAVRCRWPVTVSLLKPAFTMTMASRLLWRNKQLDRIWRHMFSAKLLNYFCYQLSGCSLIFPTCLLKLCIHASRHKHRENISALPAAHTSPILPCCSRWRNVSADRANAQGRGLTPWNYNQTIQSKSSLIITHINQILFRRSRQSAPERN